MLTVPFALLWQVMIFLLPMQLVIRNYASFIRSLPLFVIALAGMYWFWWRNLAAPASPPDVATPRENEADRVKASV